MKKRHRHTLLMFLCLISPLARSQGSVGSNADIESRTLIDLPTAGIIPHGSIAADLDFYQHGGLLAGVTVGAFNRLTVGVSYGGTNLIGEDSPAWNNMPGFNIRVRIIDETVFLPAIAVGFNSQGKEEYIDSLNRYSIKSLGLYAIGSKNYRVWGFFSWHGGINYSFERADGDDDINIFSGVEKTVGPFASLIMEYNLGINDSNSDALGRGRGYLNIGICFSLGSGLTLGMNFKDILKNQQDISIGHRTIQLEYVKSH